MKKNLYFLIIFFSIGIFPVLGQEMNVIYKPQDKTIFNRYIQTLSTKKNQPVSDLMIQTAVFLMDTPYVPKTLEVCGNKERLVVNLRQFDCVTFVESCLGLVRTLKSKNQSFETYCKELKDIRYRNGELTDFSSRLHYFTEWIANNEKKGKVINLTSGFGGKPFSFSTDFMSRKPELYPPMKDADVRTEIKEMEQNISHRKNLYLSKNVPANSRIRNGDIICLTSNVPGIGISHVGLAFRLGDILYFMHASQTDKKVVISPVSFIQYISQRKSITGYMVVRPM